MFFVLFSQEILIISTYSEKNIYPLILDEMQRRHSQASFKPYRPRDSPQEILTFQTGLKGQVM